MFVSDFLTCFRVLLSVFAKCRLRTECETELKVSPLRLPCDTYMFEVRIAPLPVAPDVRTDELRVHRIECCSCCPLVTKKVRGPSMIHPMILGAPAGQVMPMLIEQLTTPSESQKTYCEIVIH